nr:terminase family protein [Gilliamella apicola]
MSGRKIQITMTEPQAEFFNLSCKYPAFVGGFGTGKTETLAISAFRDARSSSDALIALYEPTYDLIRLILAPRMEDKLNEYGIRYKYNKSENIIYTSSGGIGDFVLRTLDNPARIIGYESYRAHVDEIDTLKKLKAQEAWVKIIARNRQKPKGLSNPFNRVSAYTTPEGFNFVYEKWKKNPEDGYRMIQASTLSNPFLPSDYVDSLRKSYPAQLIDAYINGQFVNLKTGTIYHQFNRKLNHSDEDMTDKDTLYIGMDFNVGKMVGIVHIKRDGRPIAVDELINIYDTPAIINAIKERYWKYNGNNYIKSREIYIYPDASGDSRKTVKASKTDIAQLREAGFTVIVNASNPPVKDRINAMNAMLLNADGERRYLINTNKCKRYVECLEEQAWASNGEPDKSSDNDHPNDAAGYFIVKDYPIVKPAFTIQMETTF